MMGCVLNRLSKFIWKRKCANIDYYQHSGSTHLRFELPIELQIIWVNCCLVSNLTTHVDDPTGHMF